MPIRHIRQAQHPLRVMEIPPFVSWIVKNLGFCGNRTPQSSVSSFVLLVTSLAVSLRCPTNTIPARQRGSSMSQATHQVLILDVNPRVWNLHQQDDKKRITFREFIDIVYIFTQAHLMLSKDNTVHIIAAHPSGCTVLYPSSEATASEADFDLHSLIERLLPALSLPSQRAVGGDRDPHFHHLAQALSRSLCAINRKLQVNPTNLSKILCLQISRDAPSNYNAIMNTIFSAQKFGIPVDALIFSEDDSSFLQQACLLTGGIYYKPKDQKDSLQLLFTHYLPCLTARKMLRAPLQTNVDFKAACTCHNKPVDFTFMCSVCLSLFCPGAMTEKCEICGTKIR